MKKQIQEWIPLDDSFIFAKPKDLKMGITYYVCTDIYRNRLHPQIVRERVLKQTQYGQDESNEEYVEYQKYLLVICKRKYCYIKKS